MGWKQASPYPHAHHRAPSFPPQIKNKTITRHPLLLLPTKHNTHTKLIKKTQEYNHGRRELQRGRSQARRGGAANRRRLLGEARAGQGPAVGAPRPGGRYRRYCRRLRVRQGQRLRRVPREEQAQQGAERQEEGGNQRRQLRPGIHRAVRQLQVPLQLHRLPGPCQAEESAVHQ